MIVPMDDMALRYDVKKRDLTRGRNLMIGMLAAPVVTSLLPAGVLIVLMLLFGTTPPIAFIFLVLAIIAGIAGLVVGLGVTGILALRRNSWTREMREKIAADGIRAEEIEWFRHELKASEKRALKAVTATDIMLGDAYRETLASRLTATRIVRSARRELQLMRRRENKVKLLRSSSAKQFQMEIANDIQKIENIQSEAKLMLAEAETRLQMIEAAAVRSSGIADSELALKKLSARAAELPLALEEAKMTAEIRAELEAEEDGQSKKTPSREPSSVSSE